MSHRGQSAPTSSSGKLARWPLRRRRPPDWQARLLAILETVDVLEQPGST